MLVPNLCNQNALGVGVLFDLPLGDAGAGIASLVPNSSVGSATPTFTRASSAYTRLSNGTWSLIATGQPRSMYSAAGVYLGYWPEGARADVLGTTDAIRRTMADAGWVAGATMTKSLAVGMDGVADAAACMTGGAVEATNTILFTTVLASAARTFSAWVRRKTGTGVVRMTDNGGTNWTDITLTTTYQQFQLTRTQANPIVGFQIATNLDAIEIDFNTIEAATFANPTPIPVNVSKAADVLTYVSAGNIAGANGAAYAEVAFSSIESLTAGQEVISCLSSGGILIDSNSSGGQARFRIYDGTNQANETAFVPSLGVAYKAASSWGTSGLSVTHSGIAVSTSSFDGDISATTNVGIGCSDAGANLLFGSVRNVRIYNRALTAEQLQVLTT